MAKHQIAPAATAFDSAPAMAAAGGGNVGRITKVLGHATAPYVSAVKLARLRFVEDLYPKSENAPLVLPEEPEEMRALLGALPPEAAMIATRTQLAEALRARASYEQIVSITAAFLDTVVGVPNDRRGDLVEGISLHLHIEGEMDHLSPYVLGGALLKLTRQLTFAPGVPDILRQMPETRALLHQMHGRAGFVLTLRDMLERGIKAAHDTAERRAQIARGERDPEDWF